MAAALRRRLQLSSHGEVPIERTLLLIICVSFQHLRFGRREKIYFMKDMKDRSGIQRRGLGKKEVLSCSGGVYYDDGGVAELNLVDGAMGFRPLEVFL